MIGFCTDSNAQLPAELIERYGVEVVPLTVVVDGQPFLEGVDLDTDDFYIRLAGGAQVSTAAPSPGQFVAAYERLSERGCTEILSVHLGASVSGTFNAARVAAGASPVPVRLVDTDTASFAIACCLWEAAVAIDGGAPVEEAAVIAESVARTCGNVFVVGALDLARAGGRLAADGVTADGASTEAAGIPVLTLVDGKVTPLGVADSVDEAADLMATQVRSGGERLRVGLGVADNQGAPFWHALESRLVGAPEVAEVVRYRIGPSVGVHTGPGTAGAVYCPSR